VLLVPTAQRSILDVELLTHLKIVDQSRSTTGFSGGRISEGWALSPESAVRTNVYQSKRHYRENPRGSLEQRWPSRNFHPLLGHPKLTSGRVKVCTSGVVTIEPDPIARSEPRTSSRWLAHTEPNRV